MIKKILSTVASKYFIPIFDKFFEYFNTSSLIHFFCLRSHRFENVKNLLFLFKIV